MAFGRFAFLAAAYMDKNDFSFLNPQVAEIHTDFLRGASVDNPSGRDGLGRSISLR
jgi:hypothetical protein